MDRFCNNDLEPSRSGICYLDCDQSYTEGTPASPVVQDHISLLSSHPESNISIYSIAGFPLYKFRDPMLIKTQWEPHLFEMVPILHPVDRSRQASQVTVIVAGLPEESLPSPFCPVPLLSDHCWSFNPETLLQQLVFHTLFLANPWFQTRPILQSPLRISGSWSDSCARPFISCLMKQIY
jgi:hypothetical protein